MVNTPEYEARIATATQAALAVGQRTLQLFRLGETEAENASALLKMCDFQIGAKVLDVGCGVGEVAKFFKAERPDLDIHLLNNNEFQLAQCPSGFPKYLADMHETGLPDESFDALLVCYAIGYADRDQVLKEFDRLLKPGGILFIADLLGDVAFAKRELQYDLHQLPYPNYVPAQYFSGHVKDLGPQELTDAIVAKLKPIYYRSVKRIGLAFSGGKDSWACLLLNAQRLADITVIWINAGKNFPEALEVIERAKVMCPNFVEVNVDRDAQNEREGIPSDVVPVDYTSFGFLVTGEKSVKIQSYLQCCNENLSRPLMDKCKELGITELIRGQRLDEGHKSPARDGDMVEGICFRQPIETWRTGEVLSYISERMEIPEHFALKHSSLDCYDCTAYAKDTGDRIIWARRHPALSQAFESRKAQLMTALNESMEALNAEH